MTQPSPQDELPPAPWTVRQFEHAWEIRAADGGLICFVQSEPLARAIAEIPEREEFARKRAMDIVTLGAECGRLTTANDRLRAEALKLKDLVRGLDRKSVV